MTHGAGSFMGELAQRSGRPALVDGIALADAALHAFLARAGDGPGAPLQARSI